MKKLLSFVLALGMTLSMSTAVFAATQSPSNVTSAEVETTFNFNKVYKTTAGEVPATYPTETLKFTVNADSTNPTSDPKISIADHTVTGNSGEVVITIPAYTEVGRYNYEVVEVEGSTQGVTYSDTKFDVQVLVTYDDEQNLVKQVAFKTNGTDGKVDTIVNNYDLGALSVDKVVSGNLASETQLFDINVTFTSLNPVLSAISGAADIAVGDWKFDESQNCWSVTKTIQTSGEADAVTFNNIPKGVEYVVEEDSRHAVADPNGSNSATGYTVSYEKDKGTIIKDTTQNAVVTNTKGTTVDTGIALDSLPYIMILAVAFIGLVVFMGKKRLSR